MQSLVWKMLWGLVHNVCIKMCSGLSHEEPTKVILDLKLWSYIQTRSDLICTLPFVHYFSKRSKSTKTCNLVSDYTWQCISTSEWIKEIKQKKKKNDAQKNLEPWKVCRVSTHTVQFCCGLFKCSTEDLSQHLSNHSRCVANVWFRPSVWLLWNPDYFHCQFLKRKIHDLV